MPGAPGACVQPAPGPGPGPFPRLQSPPGSAHTLLGELPALKANLAPAAEGALGEGPGEPCAPEPPEAPPLLPVGPEVKAQTGLRGM